MRSRNKYIQIYPDIQIDSAIYRYIKIYVDISKYIHIYPDSGTGIYQTKLYHDYGYGS